MNVLVLYGHHEAPAIQDIYFNNPFKILEKRKQINFNLIEINKLNLKEIKEYSLVIISRVFDKKVIDVIEFCNKADKKVLFFLDDDILGFPVEYYLNYEHFYKNNESIIIEILKKSTALVVSTDKLRDTYKKFNPLIYVTSPSLNIDFIKQRSSIKTQHIKGKKFTLGYAGSFGHVVDFRFMEKALFDFYTKNYPNVCIEFMGCIPEIFADKIDKTTIKLIHWESDYYEYLKKLHAAHWNIALCPVLESDYTTHKTNIKFLEYSSSKKAGIYSDIIIYNNDVIDYKNGLLAKNDYQSWLDKLEFAFNNKSQIESIANEAYNYVLGNYSYIKSADLWSTILTQYSAKGIRKYMEKTSILFYKFIKVIRTKGLFGLLNKISKLLFKHKSSPFYIKPKIIKGNSRIKIKFKEPVSQNYDKKQILFLVPWLSVGGADAVNITIAKFIDKEKFAIHFITTEISDNKWEKRFRKITNNIFHIRAIIKNAQDFGVYNNLILDYIEDAKIDIVIVSNSANGYICLPVIRERFAHVKIIDILHGQGGGNEGGGFPEYSNPYDNFINKRITVNHYLKNYLIEKYLVESNKIEVVHNCIDINDFKKENLQRSEIFNVVFIGRLAYEKHPEIIIKIAEKFFAKSNRENVCFRIIGDGPLYSELKKRIDLSGLKKYIKLTGHKENVKEVLEETDILLLCSEMEGLPIVILEAMSMSVPCIASNVGGIPELIDDGINGYLIDYNPEMIDSFAEKLDLLFNNESLRNNFAMMAREKIARQFSISSMIENYNRILNDL